MFFFFLSDLFLSWLCYSLACLVCILFSYFKYQACDNIFVKVFMTAVNTDEDKESNSCWCDWNNDFYFSRWTKHPRVLHNYPRVEHLVLVLSWCSHQNLWGPFSTLNIIWTKTSFFKCWILSSVNLCLHYLQTVIGIRARLHSTLLKPLSAWKPLINQLKIPTAFSLLDKVV